MNCREIKWLFYAVEMVRLFRNCVKTEKDIAIYMSNNLY